MSHMSMSQNNFYRNSFPIEARSLYSFSLTLEVYEQNMTGRWTKFVRWVGKIAEWVTNSVVFLPYSKPASFGSLNNLNITALVYGAITSSRSDALDNSCSFVQVVNIGASCIPLSELNT